MQLIEHVVPVRNPFVMKKILFLSFMLAGALGLSAQTKIIAHRGFWDTSGSAQNGIMALLKADSIGAYGSEFDVWLTKDGRLVLNHDNRIDGRSVEDYTLAELKQRRLENGEPMPTLEEFLTVAKAKTTLMLVLELKPHATPLREDRAVKDIVDMVRRMGLESRVSYISFSLNAVRQFIRLAPQGTPVFYLNGELSPEELKELGCAGPDYHMDVFRRNPEWIDRCHELGMKVNVWTVNRAEDRARFMGVADYLTTDRPVEALEEASAR